MFNVSWDRTNDIRNIEAFRVIVMGDGNITDNITVLQPGALIPVHNEIKNPRFLLETVDKCNMVSRSDIVDASYIMNYVSTTAATTECSMSGKKKVWYLKIYGHHRANSFILLFLFC